MIVKSYPVEFEVAGSVAMFTRPDTGSSPISYPVPTRSALKGLFETIVFSKEAYFWPRKVKVCAPIIYHKYTTNYSGPLKKTGTQNFQFFATILSDVCYKVYGEVLADCPPTYNRNPQHQLQEIFTRRLQKGEFYSTPCLGWKEFVPTYFGPIRETTKVDATIHLHIPSMLDVMFDRSIIGQLSPVFRQNLFISKGEFLYDQ